MHLFKCSNLFRKTSDEMSIIWTDSLRAHKKWASTSKLTWVRPQLCCSTLKYNISVILYSFSVQKSWIILMNILEAYRIINFLWIGPFPANKLQYIFERAADIVSIKCFLKQEKKHDNLFVMMKFTCVQCKAIIYHIFILSHSFFPSWTCLSHSFFFQVENKNIHV